MARIGIFSGTFDPVHTGHIAFALAAVAEGKLDRVVLLPESEPRGKQHVVPLPQRAAMLRLATGDHPSLDVLELRGRRFNVSDTLPELLQRFPGDSLSLLLGSDVVETFTYRWPGLERLLMAMELLIALRSQQTRTEVVQQLQGLERNYPNVRVRYAFVDSAHSYVASSQVRMKTTNASELLSPSVATYIATHQLYKDNPHARMLL